MARAELRVRRTGADSGTDDFLTALLAALAHDEDADVREWAARFGEREVVHVEQTAAVGQSEELRGGG